MLEAHRSRGGYVEQQATLEIIRLHDFISGWFRGEVSRETFDAKFTDALHPAFENIQPSGIVLARENLLQPIRAAHGSNPDFHISIETPHLIAQYSDQIIMGYVEFQQGARNSAAENRRRSTAIFETKGRQLIWRHLHETALPKVSNGSRIDNEG